MYEPINLTKEIVQANAKDIYKDAAQPSIRVVGQSLAQCVSLFAKPVGKIAEIMEANIMKYLNKLNDYTQEQIKSPDVRILVPILEKFRYIEDDYVADYYAEILAKASLVENANQVIVSFIEILNRLCADELKILEFINSDDNIFIYKNKEGEEEKMSFKGVLPVIDVRVKQKNGGHIETLQNLSYLEDHVQLTCIINYNLYIDNLISLGLIKKPSLVKVLNDFHYSYLKENNSIQKLKNNLQEGQSLEFVEGRLALTSLGESLLSISLKK